MSNEEPKTYAAASPLQEQNPTAQATPEQPPPEPEPGLDPVDDPAVYPLRDPGQDAVWAVRTVQIWLGIALACIAGIFLLLVLGLFND